MFALFIARLETPNRTMIGSVLVIAAGTAIAAYGEVAFNVVGVLIMWVVCHVCVCVCFLCVHGCFLGVHVL